MSRRAVVLLCVASSSTLLACYDPQPSANLPCSEASQCPAGQACNLERQLCEVPPDDVWRLESALDFAAGELGEGTLDPDGAVSAQRYLTGALRMRGANELSAVDARLADWATLTRAPAGSGFVRSIYQQWEDGIPQGTGLTQADDITVWFEGELFLEEGDWQIRLHADDEGFLELAAPGAAPGTGFQRVVESTYLAAATVTFHADTTGWYGLRGAVEDRTQFAHYLLEAGRDLPRMIPPERLRVAVGNQRGALLEAFNSPHLLYPRAATLSPTIGGTFGDVVPADLGLTDDPNWSLRYAAQFFVAKEQRVSLQVSSLGGHRLWIDRGLVSERFADPSADATTDPMTLQPGWHELVAELSKRTLLQGGLTLAVVEGDPDLLATDRLIPAEGALRVVNASASAILTLPANGSARASLNVGSRGTGTLRAVNARYSATGALADLSVRLETPVGSVPLRATGSLSGTTIDDFVLVLPDLITTPVTTWSLLARNAGATAGTFGAVGFAAEYEGSDDSVGDEFTYVSPSRPVDPSLQVDAVRWTTEPPRSPIRVSVRSCATERCEGDPSWVDVEMSGAQPALEMGAFMQVRVEAAVSEAKPVRLDSLEVAFLRR